MLSIYYLGSWKLHCLMADQNEECFLIFFYHCNADQREN